MTRLYIALNDGFADDRVSVAVEGQRVYEKDHVKTDLRISRADEVEVEAPEGEAVIEVRARGQSATARVDAAERPYVGVDISPQGRLEIRQSDEPFPML